MKRLLVASRTRADIDLPKNLGMYELTVVPPSLFASDGTFYEHINHILSRVKKSVGLLRKFQPVFPRSSLLTTYKTTVVISTTLMLFMTKITSRRFTKD